jgi:hypothetical protein
MDKTYRIGDGLSCDIAGAARKLRLERGTGESAPGRPLQERFIEWQDFQGDGKVKTPTL